MPANLTAAVNSLVHTSTPGVVKVLSLIITPVAAFFAVPVFMGLGLMLLVDLLTGFYKARVLQKVCSTRFGDIFNRALYYLAVFIVLHLMKLTIPDPYSYAIMLFNGFILSGYLLKEAISVLENLKAIQLSKGIEDPILDALIHKFGIDIDHILADMKAPTVLVSKVPAVLAHVVNLAVPTVAPVAVPLAVPVALPLAVVLPTTTVTTTTTTSTPAAPTATPEAPPALEAPVEIVQEPGGAQDG